MDKEIPKSQRRRRSLLRLVKVAVPLLAALAIVVWFVDFSRPDVKVSQLKLGEVTCGDIESTISAGGQVSPLVEEHLLSPITSRIREVYKSPGEVVDSGEPLLLLELDQVNDQLKELYDQKRIKEENARQEQIRMDADLENRELQLETKRMTLQQLRQDLQNEIYLDSLGSGTGENVRRAQMALRSAEVEIRQLERDLANQRDFNAANVSIKQLEMETFLRKLEAMEKTLTDARILAPRRAVLTKIVSKIGQSVSAQSEVAVIADLSSYIVEGQLADSYINKVKAGQSAIIRIAGKRSSGHISEISPVSENSVLAFKAEFIEPADSTLRPGLRADVFILMDVLHDVVRIPNGAYFNAGPGNYDLFVLSADGTQLERRSVTLGRSNFDYVEVVSGLKPGEKIAVSDVKQFSRNSKLKVSK